VPVHRRAILPTVDGAAGWVVGTGCTLTVCRDCCCGSLDKHPDVDHDGQVTALRAAAADRHRIRVAECLGVCERSNVVVVQPSPAARRGGARTVHLGGILDDELIAAVAGWVGAGGPGVAPIPPILAGRRFPRPSVPAERAAAAAPAAPIEGADRSPPRPIPTFVARAEPR